MLLNKLAGPEEMRQILSYSNDAESRFENAAKTRAILLRSRR